MGVALALAILVLIVGAPAPASGSVEDDHEALRQVRAELLETTGQLEHVDAEAMAVSVALEEARHRLASARDRLRRLRAELAAAVGAQQAAEGRHDSSQMALGQATRAVEAAQAAWDAHKDAFESEVVESYKYGNAGSRLAGTLGAMEESGNVSEFLTVEEKLRYSAESRFERVEYASDLAAELGRRQAHADELRRQAEAAERIAVQQRTRVATLTRQQTLVVTEVETERRGLARLLGKLEQQRAAYASDVEILQAESERLTQELSAYMDVAGALGEGDLVWPTDGSATSGFGSRVHPIFKMRRMHAGIDIPAPTGQPVYAAGDGVVMSAGVRGGYGNAVVVQHPDGISTLYAHLSQIDVQEGDEVARLDAVGEIGSTGNSTGPHLHFEIRVDGVPADPMDWFDD